MAKSKAETANEVEVTREEMIRAEVEKLRAKDDAELAAQAAAKVDAELAAKAEEAARQEQAARDAAAREEQAKERAASVQTLATSVAAWMVENGCTDPRSITDTVMSDLKAKAGIA